jgi:hypothetical protein
MNGRPQAIIGRENAAYSTAAQPGFGGRAIAWPSFRDARLRANPESRGSDALLDSGFARFTRAPE